MLCLWMQTDSAAWACRAPTRTGKSPQRARDSQAGRSQDDQPCYLVAFAFRRLRQERALQGQGAIADCDGTWGVVPACG